MENDSEESVVDEVFVGVVGFLEIADVTVEETQLTAQISTDGRRADAATVFGETLTENVEHGRCLVDGLWLTEQRLLACAQTAELNIISFDHQLEHETGHLSLLGIDGGVVVDDCNIVCTLQQTVEIMLVDGYLVVDGGQSVSFTDGVGDERSVVDATGHVTLVAGEQQHVVEIKVTRFEHTHDLDTLCRLAVEGDRGGLYDLCNKALQRRHVDGEDTAVGEIAQAVEQGVHLEDRFRLQIRVGFYCPDDIEEPVEEGGTVGEMGRCIILWQQGGIGMTGDDVKPATTE